MSEICFTTYPLGRGLHGPDFSVQARPAWLQSRPGPARSKEKNFGLGPARPGPKEKLKFRPEPGPARKGN